MPRARTFRLAVLVLCVGYQIEVAVTADYGAFGAQLRYLTIWALTGNSIAAALMLTDRWGQPDGRGDLALSVLAVVNALVVFSYWRLFFIDPALVNGDRTPRPYREYYLHLAGPVLMWVDFFWLKRGFRRLAAPLLGLAVAVLVYAGWAELLVRPLNDAPVGDVTAGLPYPFLNDMAPGARAVFYLSIYGTGVLFAVGFYALGGLLRRSASSRADRPAR